MSTTVADKEARFSFHWDEAQRMLSQNNREGAIEEFKKASALYPGDTDTLCAIANCLKNCGRREESISVLKEAFSIDPEDPFCQHSYGYMLFEQYAFGDEPFVRDEQREAEILSLLEGALAGLEKSDDDKTSRGYIIRSQKYRTAIGRAYVWCRTARYKEASNLFLDVLTELAEEDTESAERETFFIFADLALCFYYMGSLVDAFEAVQTGLECKCDIEPIRHLMKPALDLVLEDLDLLGRKYQERVEELEQQKETLEASIKAATEPDKAGLEDELKTLSFELALTKKRKLQVEALAS